MYVDYLCILASDINRPACDLWNFFECQGLRKSSENKVCIAPLEDHGFTSGQCVLCIDDSF